MSQVNETAVLDACRVLFGSDSHLGRDFLFYLQPEGLKAAFRIKAKETHPDRFGDCDPGLRNQQTRAFQHVRRAYEVVDTFLKLREKGLWAPAGSVPPRAGTPHSPPPGRPQPHRSGPRSGAAAKPPARTFQFGAYLLYRDLISYRTLILALVWQKNQRPPIGEIARHWGWLNEEEIRRINGQGGPYRRFGERAIGLDLLSPFQVRTLLWHQRSRQKKLGQFFVDQGLLTSSEVERLVARMKEHNTKHPPSSRR